MFRLAGDPADRADARAKLVLEFETAIAKASMDRVTMRDPNNTYHMMTRTELAALTPNFPWEDYFKGIGAPAFDRLNVAQPNTFKQLNETLAGMGMEAVQAYFAFHLLRAAADLLPQAFENEDFDFWQRTLAGVQQPRPREIRCAAAADRALGDLLGQKYIEIAFGPDAKAQITQLVEGLEKSMGKDIETLPWMTDATKKAALANSTPSPTMWGIRRSGATTAR